MTFLLNREDSKYLSQKLVCPELSPRTLDYGVLLERTSAGGLVCCSDMLGGFLAGPTESIPGILREYVDTEQMYGGRLAINKGSVSRNCTGVPCSILIFFVR